MDTGGKPICDVTWLGQVDYDAAWHLQETLAVEIAARRRPPVLLLLEHPHVYTLGRRTGPGHILWDEAEQQARAVQVRAVDRGGDVTYHGPGQLVGYPLLPLAPPGWQSDRLPRADFVGYVRKLEETLIHALAQLGLVAGQRPGLTGVWVMADVWGRCARCDPRVRPQPAKIASIGVKVDTRGVTRHGFALNIAPDRAYWDGIIPCGLDGVQMADLADFFDPPPRVEQVAKIVAECFAGVFNLELQWKSSEEFLNANLLE